MNQTTIVALGVEYKRPIVVIDTETEDPIPNSGDVNKNGTPNLHQYHFYIYRTCLVAKVISLHNNQSGGGT